ncbi:MAG: SH3 domain-containing protein [Candidatus Acidiferrum sp.]
MLASPKCLMVASALLLAGLPALSAEETPNVAPVRLPTAVVKCPGLTAIPFTSDEQQALPLHIVGSLTCGDTIAVLSDQEGYTALIRTRDGQEGYVARMYLATDAGETSVVAKPQPSVATPVNGVVRWEAGAPGCDAFVSRGRSVESITANGITVQVSLQDSGWKYRTNVAISNQSGGSVDVLPGIVTLDELEPNLRPLRATDALKLAHTPTHQVLWTSADAMPSPSAVVLHSRNAPVEVARRTSPAPDYLNPHMTLALARPATFARSESVDLKAIALRNMSLPTGQKTSGVMWFDRDGSARELSLRVPVGDMVFDFAFSIEQKK